VEERHDSVELRAPGELLHDMSAAPSASLMDGTIFSARDSSAQVQSEWQLSKSGGQTVSPRLESPGTMEWNFTGDLALVVVGLDKHCVVSQCRPASSPFPGHSSSGRVSAQNLWALTQFRTIRAATAVRNVGTIGPCAQR